LKRQRNGRVKSWHLLFFLPKEIYTPCRNYVNQEPDKNLDYRETFQTIVVRPEVSSGIEKKRETNSESSQLENFVQPHFKIQIISVSPAVFSSDRELYKGKPNSQDSVMRGYIYIYSKKNVLVAVWQCHVPGL
jgi:hypothetical protein